MDKFCRPKQWDGVVQFSMRWNFAWYQLKNTKCASKKFGSSKQLIGKINWSFQKKISYINQKFGCPIYPNFFWKNTETMFYRIFIVPLFFGAIR